MLFTNNLFLHSLPIEHGICFGDGGWSCLIPFFLKVQRLIQPVSENSHRQYTHIFFIAWLTFLKNRVVQFPNYSKANRLVGKTLSSCFARKMNALTGTGRYFACSLVLDAWSVESRMGCSKHFQTLMGYFRSVVDVNCLCCLSFAPSVWPLQIFYPCNPSCIFRWWIPNSK